MKHLGELIIFDWDGTLADTADELVGALQLLIQDTGLPERPSGRLRELARLGAHEALARLFPELDPSHVLERARQHRRRHSWPRSQPRLFDGVTGTLAQLRGQGFELAVATGKSRHGLDRALRANGCRELFSITRCASEAAPKPAPDMLDDILLRMATEPAAALLVGDTEYDMRMAQAAGVAALGVRSGVHDEVRLRRAGALDVIDDVCALPAWLAGGVDPVLVAQASGQCDAGFEEQAAQRDQR